MSQLPHVDGDAATVLQGSRHCGAEIVSQLQYHDVALQVMGSCELR